MLFRYFNSSVVKIWLLIIQKISSISFLDSSLSYLLENEVTEFVGVLKFLLDWRPKGPAFFLLAVQVFH